MAGPGIADERHELRRRHPTCPILAGLTPTAGHGLHFDMRTTRNQLIVFAMRRSGHHAVVHFIYRMYDAPKAFYNNLKPYREEFGTNKKDISDGDTTGDLELFVVNYEDQLVREEIASPSGLIQDHEAHVGLALNSHYVLCLRDPFNTFSSRLNHGEGRRIREQILHDPQRTIDLWKNHAAEFVGRTKVLPNLVTANYNEWLVNEDYRRDLADRLGIPYKSKNWNQTTREGGGSTFDKRAIKHADRMQLLERWKLSKDDPSFRRLFEDRELVELSQEIFGEIPGTEELIP